MARTKCTIFAPSLGCWYKVLNRHTGKEVIAKVLGPADKDVEPEIRSGKKTERGQEFFKIWVDGKILKMMNSSMFEECLSDDPEKTYKFIDKSIRVGTDIAKSDLPQIPRTTVSVPVIEPVDEEKDLGVVVINEDLINELIAA